MLDVHCHLDLQPGSPAVAWADARKAGLSQAVMAGVDPSGWASQRRLCASHVGLHRTAGLHPWTVAGMTPAQLENGLRDLRDELDTDDPKLIGVGELGLDRSKGLGRRGDLRLELQTHAFRAQLEMASHRGLPLVLHVVRAHGQALEMVRELDSSQRRGVVHSFSGSRELAHQWIAQGFHLSISPQVLKSTSRKLREAIPAIPSDRLLVETDSPDQAPGPASLVEVISCVAQLRGVSPEMLAEQTHATAHRLFGLGPIA